MQTLRDNDWMLLETLHETVFTDTEFNDELL